MRRRRQTTNARVLWNRFDSIRSNETGGDQHLLLDSFVSSSVPALSTYRDLVEKMVRQSTKPIPIASLPCDLSQKKLIRGKVVFGLIGDEIDKIALAFDNVRWWISKEGLNMALVPPEVAKLSQFDELVGKLYCEASEDGELSKEVLLTISNEIDAAGFRLNELLQPAQKRAIAEYNQKNARQPIQTFKQACLHRVSRRAVRRRMYLAREKYIKANSPVSSPSGLS